VRVLETGTPPGVMSHSINGNYILRQSKTRLLATLGGVRSSLPPFLWGRISVLHEFSFRLRSFLFGFYAVLPIDCYLLVGNPLFCLKRFLFGARGKRVPSLSGTLEFFPFRLKPLWKLLCPISLLSSAAVSDSCLIVLFGIFLFIVVSLLHSI